MSRYLIDLLGPTDNVRVQVNGEVLMAHGERQLEAITITDLESGAQQTCRTAAVFVFIGALPRTDWLPGFIARDDQGFLLTGMDLQAPERHTYGWSLDRDPFVLETSAPGIFVAGDVRHGSIKRVASAVGEGAVVVRLIHEYLSTTRTRVE
jgi:thioredoxin reductase (NADPH)